MNGNEYEIEDKRLILQKFLNRSFQNKNFRSIILEDNFMFSDGSRRHLNYNHINLKSLKSIEILTSSYSDFIFILHESYSTAAEIGMFSTSESNNNKLMILTPNDYSVEEDYVSGFMKLAYQNKYYSPHNIKTIYYNPGVYNFYISDYVRKLHTFFVNNEVNGVLSKELNESLGHFGEKEILFGKYQGFYNKIRNNYSILSNNKIKINLNSNDLLAYIISLFNISTFKQEFISSVDMSHLRMDNVPNRRKSLFKDGTHIVQKYFKQAIYNTLKIDIPKLEHQYGPIENIDSFITFSISHQVEPFERYISYILYILFALQYINITDENTRFSITNAFSPVYNEYIDLIQEIKSAKKMWSR